MMHGPTNIQLTHSFVHV